MSSSFPEIVESAGIVFKKDESSFFVTYREEPKNDDAGVVVLQGGAWYAVFSGWQKVSSSLQEAVDFAAWHVRGGL
jgi:hypothetical protein